MAPKVDEMGIDEAYESSEEGNDESNDDGSPIDFADQLKIEQSPNFGIRN